LNNPSIESLNLDGNDIGAEALQVICKMISEAKGCRLQRLSLEHNPFGTEGVLHLAKVVARTLRYLNWAGNQIEDAGVAALKAAVQKKTNCLFELSGLESSKKKKLAVSSSEIKSQGPAKKKKTVTAATSSRLLPNIKEQDSDRSQIHLCTSEPTPTTTSTMAAHPTSTSDNAACGSHDGSDDGGPTSSMNESDDAPSSSPSVCT
jgi:hypothetical protein